MVIRGYSYSWNGPVWEDLCIMLGNPPPVGWGFGTRLSQGARHADLYQACGQHHVDKVKTAGNTFKMSWWTSANCFWAVLHTLKKQEIHRNPHLKPTISKHTLKPHFFYCAQQTYSCGLATHHPERSEWDLVHMVPRLGRLLPLASGEMSMGWMHYCHPCHPPRKPNRIVMWTPYEILIDEHCWPQCMLPFEEKWVGAEKRISMAILSLGRQWLPSLAKSVLGACLTFLRRNPP